MMSMSWKLVETTLDGDRLAGERVMVLTRADGYERVRLTVLCESNAAVCEEAERFERCGHPMANPGLLEVMLEVVTQLHQNRGRLDLTGPEGGQECPRSFPEGGQECPRSLPEGGQNSDATQGVPTTGGMA